MRRLVSVMLRGWELGVERLMGWMVFDSGLFFRLYFSLLACID